MKNKVTATDWKNARRPQYMRATFEKLGWAPPKQPPFLPKDWAGVGKLPYKPYAAELLNGPAPFPEPGDLTKPWVFMGKTHNP